MQALPAEPGAGDEDVVQVAVRMPSGTRFIRRYAPVFFPMQHLPQFTQVLQKPYAHVLGNLAKGSNASCRAAL